jgi:photosystem II stability/assembly factor-like uncharacterized protein
MEIRFLEVYLYSSMRTPIITRLLFTIFLWTGIVPSLLYSQWKKIAPNLMIGNQSYTCAIHFKDGVLWAGGYRSELYVSRDSGSSWTTSIINDSVASFNEIEFYNKNIGVVSTMRDGIWITYNGGQSWKRIYKGRGCPKVFFNKSPNIIHAIGYDGTFHTTLDGGTSWRSIGIGSEANSFAIGLDGVIHAFVIHFVGLYSYGKVMSSSDLGLTWTTKNATVDGDCYSISADSCDPNKLYLINEDYINRNNGISQVYMSTDAGNTWSTMFQAPRKYLSGAMTSSKNTLYAGIKRDDFTGGFLRSSDRGNTWQELSGPASIADSRSITKANNNIFFAIDDAGSIWKTVNNSGDSLIDVALKSGGRTISDTLFQHDSLYFCDSPRIKRRTFVFTDCSEHKLVSQRIEGRDSADYFIEPNVDSMSSYVKTKISFKPADLGSRNAQVVLTFENGAKIIIPLRGFSKGPTKFTYSHSPVKLFSNDSLFLCDTSLRRTLVLASDQCPRPKILSQEIVGKDSMDYTVEKFFFTDTLRSYDSISIAFHPSVEGKRNAKYRLTLEDSTVVEFELEGYCKGQTPLLYSSKPDSAFIMDSLFLCDSLVYRTIELTVNQCPSPSIVSQSIVGINSTDYSIVQLFKSTPLSLDSCLLTFKPNGNGTRTAHYEIILDNGDTIRLPLVGYSKGQTPFSYTLSADSLFYLDTLFVCDQPISARTILTIDQCPMPRIISQSIVGIHANDYIVNKYITEPLEPLDSIILSFKPSEIGFRQAQYVVIFDNGSQISIPLHAFVKGISPLAFSTSDYQTDTIGGSVQIPIFLNGLTDKRDIELVLHYDEGLDYEGSFSTSGTRLDMNGQQWKGRSKLYIPNAASGAPLGYSNFSVYADSTSLPKVIFDSLVVLNPTSPCEYVLPTPIISTITPPSGCGVQILSRFIHLGEEPNIRLYPNPANDNISLITDSDIQDAEVVVIDMLGSKQRTYTTSIKAGTPFVIDLTPLVNGVYTISVTSSMASSRLSFVLSR